MEPVIKVYTKEERKRPYGRFGSFIEASFWIGLEYGRPEGKGNVKLVSIEVYSAGDPEGSDELKEFENLLVDRGIDQETKFFDEPHPSSGSVTGD